MLNEAAACPASELGFLASLRPGTLARLRAAGTRRTIEAGAPLFHEGDCSTEVYLVLQGRIKIVSCARGGQEAVLAVRSAGDIIGELSAIDNRPRSAAGYAFERAQVQVIPAATFLELLRTTPDLSLALLALVSSKLRDADRKRVEFGSDATQRVVQRLLELADRFGHHTKSTVEVQLPLSQMELAGWTMASREAVGKALRVLREAGLVQTGRRNIVITDLDGLRRWPGTP